MLEIKKLYKTFNKNTPYEKTLYNGLTLTINEGDFITVIGSNGAGKSTLFKLLSKGLEVDSGHIIFDKEESTYFKEYEMAQKIASVVQDPKVGTVGGMTVEENMAMAELKSKKAGVKFCVHRDKRTHYESLLSEFHLGLEDKLDIKTELLSGGQRQVLSLLMASMTIPKLLLLDEHTAALDPKTSEKVMDITDKLVKEHYLTCLMITHKLEDAIKYGNRLIMIHEGEILLDIDGVEKSQLTIPDLLEQYQKVKSSLSDRQLFC